MYKYGVLLYVSQTNQKHCQPSKKRSERLSSGFMVAILDRDILSAKLVLSIYEL